MKNSLSRLNTGYFPGQSEADEVFGELGRLCEASIEEGESWHQALVALRNVFHCAVAAICVLSEREDEFKVTVNYGDSTDTDGNEVTLHLPVDEGIAGWVFSRNEAYLANSLVADPLYLRTFDKATGLSLQSMISTPVEVDGQTLGVLMAFHRNDSFSGNELHLLRSFSGLLVPEFRKRAAFRSFYRTLSKFTKGYKAAVAEERLAAMSLMAAGVAHEIQSPLAAMSGNIQLLARKITEPGLLKKIERIEQSIRSVNIITNGLFSFSRRASSSWENVDINAIVSDAISRIRAVLPEESSVVIVTKFGSSLPPVEAYADELRQVFINILENAHQAMPEGGEIVVTTALEEAGAAEYNESIERIVISVSDSGPGIPKRYRDKVFVPFFSEGKLAGSGLGLSLCRSIMKRHRGEITFECPESGGTRFLVYIPVFKSEMRPNYES